MTESSFQRISDDDRDRAAADLQEHLIAGRITSEEFDLRITRALTAHTAGELGELFRDLPKLEARPNQVDGSQFVQLAPLPNGASVPQMQPAGGELIHFPRATRALAMAAGVTWPLAVMVVLILGWEYSWSIVLPLILSVWAGRRSQRRGSSDGPPA